MKAKPLFLAVTGLLIASGAFAQATPQADQQRPKIPLHAMTIDKNGDGAISREEAGAKTRMSAQFDTIDSNKDGELSKEELHAFRNAAHQQRKSAFDQRFKEADKDGDGALSKAEAENARLPGRAAHFDKADANQDGKVSKEELHAGRKSMHDRQAARFKAADKDGDGALTKAEAEAGKLNRLAQHFDELDANKDGKIGPEELHAGRHKPQAKTI